MVFSRRVIRRCRAVLGAGVALALSATSLA